MRYVRFIDENTVEDAPVNYGNIVNFNLCPEIMEKFGYKPLKEVTLGDIDSCTYKEEKNYIKQVKVSNDITTIINRCTELLHEVKAMNSTQYVISEQNVLQQDLTYEQYNESKYKLFKIFLSIKKQLSDIVNVLDANSLELLSIDESLVDVKKIKSCYNKLDKIKKTIVDSYKL